MLTLLAVAVTGSIASGKSTVCQFFEKWGAYVVDADQLLHQVFSIETPIGKRICSLFGESVLKGTEINRVKLAKAAFAHQQLLEKLEDICHPYVNQAIKDHYKQACNGSYSFFAAEVPLLFESRFPLAHWFDTTLLVAAKNEIAEVRCSKRGLTEKEYLERMSRQHSLETKRKKASYIIHNNGSLAELETTTKQLFNELSQLTPTQKQS